MDKLKVIYCASGQIAVPLLEALRDNSHVELVSVISGLDRPAGRHGRLNPVPIVTFARKWKIPLLQTPDINQEDEVPAMIEKYKVDIVLVFAFSHFLKENLLSAPSLGCFNIHPSLLPLYRGAAPLQYALLNGDKQTGVSIQKMASKMDAGDLVFQRIVPIEPGENLEQLQNRMGSLISKYIQEFFELARENKFTYQVQDDSKATYAPRLKKEDGRIDFTSRTNEEICNLIRAFTPWPSAFCTINGRLVKILKAVVSPRKLDPGGIYQTGELIVGCRKGSIRLCRIQREGKRPCDDGEFLNGFKGKISLE